MSNEVAARAATAALPPKGSGARGGSYFSPPLARFGTIPDLVPVLRPLFTPGERALTDGADFRGKVLLGRLALDFSFAARH